MRKLATAWNLRLIRMDTILGALGAFHGDLIQLARTRDAMGGDIVQPFPRYYELQQAPP